MFTPLESLVLATLAYTAQFDYPLSQSEICQRCLSYSALKTVGVKLVGHSKADALKITQKNVSRAVQSLSKRKYLVVNKAPSSADALICLASKLKPLATTTAVDYFHERQARSKLAKKRLHEWSELRQMLLSVPWVLAAAITGSAAMANGTKKSDLDVMVIAMPGRLWLARLWVLVLTWLQRRRHSTGWCFNLWLEPSEMGLAPQRQGVYEAYELWQCYWLLDRASWRLVWLDRNSWFREFLPLAGSEPKFFKPSTQLLAPSRQADIWPDWFSELANSWAYLIQVHYRKWRHGEAKAPRNQAFLHASDSRSGIYARWQQKLTQIGLIN